MTSKSSVSLDAYPYSASWNAACVHCACLLPTSC